MNWILIGMIVLLAQKENHASIYGMANPVPKGPSQSLNPFIRHWEAANFDRSTLEVAHRVHQEQLRRRQKRDLRTHEYGPPHSFKLNFFAHDREFRLVLNQDPMSVFVPDVEIENTLGPLDYDISRVYTGSLEDDENSHIHAMLTHDNLLDGTIATKLEQFYIEPSQKYSDELPKAGIHSIVYKIGDVRMKKSVSSGVTVPIDSEEHCASEKLRRKLLRIDLEKRRKSEEDARHPNVNARKNPFETLQNDVLMSHNRRKRWLPDELSDSQNPPLPLDLEVPYNDDIGIFTRNMENVDDANDSRKPFGIASGDVVNRNPSHGGNNRNIFSSKGDVLEAENGAPWKTSRNRNIIVNDYSPSNDFSIRSHLTNRNMLVNSFNSSNIKLPNFYNESTGNGSSSNNTTSRPSHKTHVEIITKNGATKKPNILVNNYNPDIILTSQNYNSHLSLNVLRNDPIESASARMAYDKKSTCMLYLQADHTFFQKMGSDEASIEAITRHVQRANAIYKNTDFNGDGKPDNITFMIKRIKVHNMNALKDPTYRFPGNYGVEKFLELFSEEDYDAFCLAYMFTYRDFEMGTLGLAWTGDLKNAGGVCEKNGHYRGSLKSLNTGIVTLLNYGKHVPPAVSHVTLAHEIGHNFGSPHDPDQCTPGGEDGNYIMFARATSGDKKNNNKFSPCSLKAIEPVLNAKARSAKGCFTEPQQSICGNGVVEQGEECDCGWEEDCKDACCFPMSRHPRSDEKPCTLTTRAMCSPSQGPCCTTDCSLKFGDKCRDDNGCRDPSFCDGRAPQCPPSVNKPNKTICNKEFVCYMGECTGSICLAYGLESCQCLPGPNDLKTKSCELCCKQPGEGNPCKSSFEWNEPPYDVPDMFAKPGTPCNDYNGYCDVFQKCREVDPSGPLATLRKLLLSEESIASFKKWLQTNWYTVLLAAVGVAVLLVLSTKLLGKRSNSKLKSVTIIHSATTETVRLPEDNNGVIVHTAVRTKVPFKKKVRGQRRKQQTSGNKTNTTPTKTGNNKTPATTKLIIKSPAKGIKRNSTSLEVTKRLSRKNRISAPAVNDENNSQPTKSSEVKKNKKNKKHKEIIDYSSNSRNHTNTFGKVQKWLLESPIVSQPLSHIEHSSKVQKVMSKSQSTPERLVQKSPKKSKSVGNLSNEKVKLQVVYKPPFKFSLKLSKNSAVKTHVIGGALSSSKRKGRAVDKKRVGAAPIGKIGNKLSEHGRRAALLVRTVEEDTQKLTVDCTEPNYETLNSKTNDNLTYENIKTNPTNLTKDQTTNMTMDDDVQAECKPSTSTFRVTRSASNGNVEKHSMQPNPFQHGYNRSNSINAKPMAAKHPTIRKNSDNSVNLSRNFGSTQNLLQASNISKSKKRSSLNLKYSANNDFIRPNMVGKQSNSNLNLKRENSSSNLRAVESTSRNSLTKNNLINGNQKSSSSSNRSSMNNIPRASLNSTPPVQPQTFVRQTSVTGKKAQPTNPFCINPNSSIVSPLTSSLNNSRPHTATCDNIRQFEWTDVDDHQQKRSKGKDSPRPEPKSTIKADVGNLSS